MSKYNVLVIGKTGVGKSSFVNYLFGKDVAKTGVGKPITQRGFHKYEFVMGDVPVILHDSWGLEVNKEREWLALLDRELEKRRISKAADRWFHSVFYLIDSDSSRITDSDIKIIKRLRQDKYFVNVVLNRADLSSLSDMQAMREELGRRLPNTLVLEVASGGSTRAGKVEPFGREAVLQAALENFFDTMLLRLPLHLKSRYNEWFKIWNDAVEDRIASVGRFDAQSVAWTIRKMTEYEVESIASALPKALNKAVKVYANALGGMAKSSVIPLDLDLQGFRSIESPSGSMFGLEKIFNGLFSGAESNRQSLYRAHQRSIDEVDTNIKRWFASVGRQLAKLKREQCGTVLGGSSRSASSVVPSQTKPKVRTAKDVSKGPAKKGAAKVSKTNARRRVLATL